MSATAAAAPYSRAAVNAMRKLYPEELADKSFDNTGLLLESPFVPARRLKNSVLLTIDLTKAVADEAIRRRDSIVVAYHPIIFRGLKSLTLQDTQQQSLLRLASEGISVYSPHTAVDAASGGLGDWLADIVSGTPTDPQSVERALDVPPRDAAPPAFLLQHHPTPATFQRSALRLGDDAHQRSAIQPSAVAGHSGAGMGRIVRFAAPVPLTAIIDRIGLGLGNPKAFPIAVPQGRRVDEIHVSTVAVCAGAGAGTFRELHEHVDLLFTGEMPHHDALAAIEKGQSVICLLHSNTERGFLHSVMKGQLERELRKEWDALRSEERAAAGLDKAYLHALEDDQVEVHVSEADRDPFGIMINQAGG